MTRDRAYWGALHVRSDKAQPIVLPDRRVRRSIGTATTVRRIGKGDAHVWE